MPRLSMSTTQSAANTFTSTSQVTGLEGQTTVGYRIIEAVFESDGPSAIAAAADDFSFALGRQDRTAMPLVTDVDVLYKFSLKGVNMAGTWVPSTIITWQPDREIIIVEDPIFLMVETASIAAAQTVAGELFYEVVSISAIDRLTLLTQSLSGA